MKNNFKEILHNYKSYLADTIPETGNIQTYWDDPLKSTKTRSILLPYSHSVNGAVSSFSLELWIFIVGRNPEYITWTQLEISEKLFDAVYDIQNAPEEAGIESVDYFPPTIECPNIGTIRAVVKLDIDYIDDCD